MREIKFRAWDGELKFYTSQLGYFVELDGSAWFNLGRAAGHGDNLIDQSSKLTIEQFTGLHDKNGKEIFEGDVVAFSVAHSAVGGHKRTERVEWDEYLLCWSFSNKGYIGNFYEEEANSIEVIGNIHENPELLEK